MNPSTARYVLFPGRHHLFTRFQWDELRRIVAGDATSIIGASQPDRDATVVVAVTSANHSNTRRNPVPLELRTAQAHLAAAQTDLHCLTIPVSDVGKTERFAEHVLGAVAAEESVCDPTGVPLHLRPQNCVVACSTPSVARQFAELGFDVFAMEHASSPLDGALAGIDMWTEMRPWQVVEAVAQADGNLDIEAFEVVHPASQRIWIEHRLGMRVNALFDDPIVGDDSDLTSGRDYETYMSSFDRGAERKWALLEPYAEPGRLVDIGCATGAMLALAGEAPQLLESDLIGIELSRALYDECIHRRRMGVFPNENTFFYHRNATEQLFPPGSVNTTITVSLTHEIVSYLDEAALEAMSQSVFDHTASGGVWLIYDVCAPREPDRIVRMALDEKVGVTAEQAAAMNHQALSVEELGLWLEALSVRARFDVFAATFRAEQGESLAQLKTVERHADGSVELRFGDAMDFLAHHTYTESWRSEMNERFCYRNLADWSSALSAIGFEVEPSSRTWTNPWLAEHRFAPVASLTDPATGETIGWGDTNLVVVARRP